MTHDGHRVRIRVTEGRGGWSSFATLWCWTCRISDGTTAAVVALRARPSLVSRFRERLPNVLQELGL